jgi:hypothetical protein
MCSVYTLFLPYFVSDFFYPLKIVDDEYFTGYQMRDDGTFILYESWPVTNGSLDGIMSDAFPEDGAREFSAGEMVGPEFIIYPKNQLF